MRTHSLLPLLFGFALAVPGGAAVLFDIETTQADGTVVRTGRAAIEGAAVRVDQFDAAGEPEVSLVYGEEEVVVLDLEEKWMMPIDEDTADGFGDQMTAMQEQFQAAMAQVPEQNRAQFEAMIKKQMGLDDDAGTAAEPIELVKGDNAKSGDVECRIWQVRRGDVLEQELCMADPDDVPGAGDAMAAIREMAGFFEGLMASIEKALPAVADNAAIRSNPFTRLGDVDGFPVEVRSYRGGQLDEVTRMTPAGTADLGAATFDRRPEGFQLRSLTGR